MVSKLQPSGNLGAAHYIGSEACESCSEDAIWATR